MVHSSPTWQEWSKNSLRGITLRRRFTWRINSVTLHPLLEWTTTTRKDDTRETNRRNNKNRPCLDLAVHTRLSVPPDRFHLFGAPQLLSLGISTPVFWGSDSQVNALPFALSHHIHAVSLFLHSGIALCKILLFPPRLQSGHLLLHWNHHFQWIRSWTGARNLWKCSEKGKWQYETILLPGKLSTTCH